MIATAPTVSVASPEAGTTNWARVEDEIAPSVVGVDVSTAGGSEDGSGVLLFASGTGSAYIVTDRSMFSSGSGNYSGQVEVISSGGSKVNATLVGQDPESGLALLAVSDRSGWIFASLGTVEDVREASPVIALAAPSAGGGTLAAGTVTATDHQVPLADGGDIDHLLVLATPAMNSAAGGAAAVDQNGLVIGITVKVDPIDAADQGLTFAVPIDEVVQVARQLVEGRSVEHPWLGLTQTGDLPTAVARQEGISGGASVYGVSPSSPASRLGISASDVIVSLDGSPIDSIRRPPGSPGPQPDRTVDPDRLHARQPVGVHHSPARPGAAGLLGLRAQPVRRRIAGEVDAEPRQRRTDRRQHPWRR